MEIQSLCNLLSTLEGQEWEDFSKFLKVDYLHETKLKQDQLQYVEQLATIIKKERVNVVISENTRLGRNQTKAAKNLHQLFHEFKVWERIKKSPSTKLEKIKYDFETQAKTEPKPLESIIKELTQKPNKEDQDFMHLAEFEELRYFSLSTKDKANSANLENALNNYSVFYLIHALRLISQAYAHAFSFDSIVDQGSYLPLVELMKLAVLYQDKHPAICLYKLLIQGYQQNDQATIERLHLYFNEQHHQLSIDDVSLIGMELHTLLIDAYEKTGDKKFQQHLFSLYQIFSQYEDVIRVYLQNELFLSNIAGIAASVGEIEWAQEMINTAIPYYPDNDRAQARALANTRLFLSSGNLINANESFKYLNTFKEVIRIKMVVFTCGTILSLYDAENNLKNINYTALTDDGLRKIHKRHLTLLEKYLYQFSQALNRDEQASEERKESFKNFIHFVHEIKHKYLKQECKPDNLAKIALQIKACKQVSSKGWLLDFINTRV